MKNFTPDIGQELKALDSPLQAFTKHANPFSVPEGYFDHFAQEMIERVRIAGISNGEEASHLSPLLSSLQKEQPFSVPEGYFDHFPETMLRKVGRVDARMGAREEMSVLSPLLAGVSKKNLFSVPNGYFDTLPAALDKRVVRAEPEEAGAKVISFKKPVRSVIRYLAAASIVGLLGITLFVGLNNKKTMQPDAQWTSTSLPDLPDEVLATYLQGTPEVNAGELIDSTDSVFFDSALFKVADEKEIASMLANVPERDLEDYDNDIL